MTASQADKSYGGRVDWVDYAKGFCIIMVVMVHATVGVQDEVGREGFMQWVVSFAKPFRMPDFFLISGLFLARVIDRDWRAYLDRKVVHYIYFYLLWLSIQIGLKAPHFAADFGWFGVAKLYLISLIDPFGTLWFIYLLPVFFVAAKLARAARIPPLAVLLAGAALEIAPISTGWMVVDEFASRFVFFYAGYLAAPQIFALADAVGKRPALAAAGLAAWAAMNGALVSWGYAGLPVVSLALGFLGAAAVVALATLMAKSALFAPIRYCGRHSIVIYLAFFLPMAATRLAVVHSGAIESVGLMSLIVLFAAVAGPLVIWRAARGARLGFLFERPAWARLAPASAENAGGKLQPAE